MDKEYKDYSAGTGNPSNTDIVLLQPNPDSGVVGDRIYKKWTWLQIVTSLGSFFAPKNSPITGATKTKITYDSNGLVTAGTDVGFIDITGSVSDNSTLVGYIADPTNINQDPTHRFVSDSEKSTWNGKQDSLTDVNFGTFANSLTAKTTPIDVDLVNIVDTADSNKQKKVTFTNLKAFLKTYFDTLYTGGSGSTNLGYTASPTNGVVTSDTGTDATLPLADGTNAGLLKPAKFAVLENTSGTNTGDETASRIATINHGVTAKTTPVDADEITGQDSASSFALTRFTFLDTWTNYFKAKADALYQVILSGSVFGTFMASLTAKSTLVDADLVTIGDSTSSFEAKKTTLLQMKQFFGVESVNPLGNIITETFSNLSGWSARGGTIGIDYIVSGNVLTLTGNGTNLGRAIKHNFGVCMYDSYKINYTLICDTTPSASTTGCGVGMRNPSGATGSVHNLDIRLGMDTAIGSKGYIFYSYNFDNSLIFAQYKSEVKFTDVLLGDEFRATTQIVANAVFTKMDRYTAGSYVESREFFMFFPSNQPPKFPYLPSPWEFTINIYGSGTQKVKNYSVDVLDSKEADYMIISTSIGKGTSIGTGRMLDRAARQWADLTGKRITVYASPSAKLDGLDINKIKGQPYSLNPAVIVMDLMINDLLQTGNATTITNFTTKVNALVSAGYVVGTDLFFLEVTPSNTFDVSTFNAHLYATYPFNSIIKIYGAAKAVGGTGILSTMSFDGLHPNKALESIKAMALANHFGNTIINRPVFYDEASNFSLNPILDIPTTDYDFTGLSAGYTVQSLNYSIPAGTVQAGDKLFLDVEFYTTGSANTKNIRAYIVPTTGTASASTNIVFLRTISAIGTRQPCYREMYVRANTGVANCFIQNNASSSLHPYQDSSMSDLTIDWDVDNFFMFEMNAVTSTDHIFVKSVSLNIFRK